MQNQEIIKIIENLKGRRDYEQKKATKLGFNSLYAYFEDKILKEKRAIEDKKKELEETKTRMKELEVDLNRLKTKQSNIFPFASFSNENSSSLDKKAA